MNQQRIARYLELQRSIPGMESMYELISAHFTEHVSANDEVLIVGAGGGREIEMFAPLNLQLRIAAVDPVVANFDDARGTAETTETGDCIAFVEGHVEDLPVDRKFDFATSILVMHGIESLDAKLDYLKAIRNRLKPGRILVHADICLNDDDSIEHLKQKYITHANLVQTHPKLIAHELQAVTGQRVITELEFRSMAETSGWQTPIEIFRTLWYRCWTLRV